MRNNHKINDQGDRILLFLGHFYFIALILTSAYFYQERLMNFDSALYTFWVMQFKHLYIAHHRWVSALTEWIPLLAQKLGMSYKTVLISYSAGLMALIYLVYIIIAHGLKNVRAAILLAMVFGGFYRHKFYAGISEILPSIAFGVLLIGVFTRNKPLFKNPWYETSLYFVIGCLMVLSHLVPLLPVLLVYGFWVIYNRRLGDKWVYINLALFLIPVILKLLFMPVDHYESNKISFLQQIIPIFQHPKDYYIFQLFWKYIKNEHWFSWLIFLFSLSHLAYFKKWGAFVAFLGSAAILVVLNIATFHYLKNDNYIMIDGYMVYIGIVAFFYFCIELLKSRKFKKYLIPIVFIFLSFNYLRILHSRHFFTNRLAMIKNTYERYESPTDRVLISEIGHVEWNRLWYPYQFRAESILQSTLRGMDSTVLLVTNDTIRTTIKEMNTWPRKRKNKLSLLYEFNTERFPNPYFTLPEQFNFIEVKEPAWLSKEELRQVNNWLRDKKKKKKTE